MRSSSLFRGCHSRDPEFTQAYLYLGRAYISQSHWRDGDPAAAHCFPTVAAEAQQEIMNLISRCDVRRGAQ